MRICFISRRYFPAISGMSIYAQNYLREMVKLGHDVVMISQYRNDQAGTQIYGGGPPGLINGVEVIGLESHGEQLVNLGQAADFEADITAIVDAALAVHAIKPFDIVHAQYAYPNGLAAIEISRRTGIPNTISIQGGDGHWVGLCCATHRHAIRAVFNHANELIIGSSSFAQEVHENHGIPLHRFTIVPGAINAEHFSPRPNRLLGDIESPTKLLYHGRVDRRKGVLELIEAFNLLKLAGRNLRLCISGIGPDLVAAKDLAQTLNLYKEIEFPGYVSYEDVPSVYRSADIFVSPTWSEGFSNTILEAMASGLPIVAARAVGVVDCLTHHENALLHEVHNIPDLCSKISQLLDDPALRQRLATAAIREVQTKYQWSAIALNISTILQDNLQKTPDNRWTETCKPTTTIADADLTCRFRQTPHLL
jgi:glycogen(starch) synthase